MIFVEIEEIFREDIGAQKKGMPSREILLTSLHCIKQVLLQKLLGKSNLIYLLMYLIYYRSGISTQKQGSSTTMVSNPLAFQQCRQMALLVNCQPKIWYSLESQRHLVTMHILITWWVKGRKVYLSLLGCGVTGVNFLLKMPNICIKMSIFCFQNIC